MFVAPDAVAFGRTRFVSLYHIMPLDTRWQLIHRLGGWSSTFEVPAVAAKEHVPRVRDEVATPGYAVINVAPGYEWKHACFDIGVDNVSDKFHYLPLGGAYLGPGNPMTTAGVPWGMVVPGQGRSVNTSLSLRF